MKIFFYPKAKISYKSPINIASVNKKSYKLIRFDDENNAKSDIPIDEKLIKGTFLGLDVDIEIYRNEPGTKVDLKMKFGRLLRFFYSTQIGLIVFAVYFINRNQILEGDFSFLHIGVIVFIFLLFYLTSFVMFNFQSIIFQKLIEKDLKLEKR